MARDKKPKQKSKQFTTRETVLLIALVIAGTLYAYFTYFYVPTTNEIAQLETENNTLETEYKARQSLIWQKSSLENDLGSISQAVYVYKNQYFKTTNQEHFIKILELDLLSDEKMDIASLSFSEAQPSIEFISGEAGSVQLESSTVFFPFKGSYESLIELIYRIEGFENIIRINSLDISYVDLTTDPDEAVDPNEILYQGNIGIEFFTIPQPYEYVWNDALPEYINAQNFVEGLFNYDDGVLGLPPFMVEVEVVEEIEEIIIPENENDEDSEVKPEEPEEDETSPGNAEDNNPIDDKDDQEYATYLVKSGDTVFGISVKIYKSANYVDEIMELNNLSDPRALRSGSTILLPNKEVETSNTK